MSNDTSKSTSETAEHAVDWASSKTPLDGSEHIDPVEARRSVETSQAESKATPKDEGGAAPIKAKPNRVRERDDREKEPVSEKVKSQSAHEQAAEAMRDRD